MIDLVSVVVSRQTWWRCSSLSFTTIECNVNTRYVLCGFILVPCCAIDIPTYYILYPLFLYLMIDDPVDEMRLGGQL